MERDRVRGIAGRVHDQLCRGDDRADRDLIRTAAKDVAEPDQSLSFEATGLIQVDVQLDIASVRGCGLAFVQ